MNTYFILSIVSLLGAMCLIAFKVCFASKCEEVSICYGILSVKRNVSIEEKEFHGSVQQEMKEITQMKSVIDRV